MIFLFSLHQPNSSGNLFRNPKSGGELRKISDRYRNDLDEKTLNAIVENSYEPLDRQIDDPSKIKLDFFIDRPVNIFFQILIFFLKK